MKMILLFCMEDFSDDARNMFVANKVTFFNEVNMETFFINEDDESTNWFADRHVMNATHAFMAITDDQKADQIMKSIEVCKADKGKTYVQAVKINVEQFVG